MRLGNKAAANRRRRVLSSMLQSGLCALVPAALRVVRAGPALAVGGNQSQWQGGFAGTLQSPLVQSLINRISWLNPNFWSKWLFSMRSKAGFSPDLESSRMWEASLENAKQRPSASAGICDIRSIWLQVPSFPRARSRMCRREVWVAALFKVLYLIDS
jgi:hypothetical protein